MRCCLGTDQNYRIKDEAGRCPSWVAPLGIVKQDVVANTDFVTT